MKKISILLIILMLMCIPITSLAENEDYITRADFVKALIESSKVEAEETTASTFSDVTDPVYIPFIEAAYRSGIVSGYGEIFKPDGYVTKEEAIVMIARVFGEKVKIGKISEEKINSTLSFSDSSSFSQWSKSYIAYVLNTGLVKDDNNAFYPKKLLTEKETNNLISEAKNVYNELFTREGLSASEMLILANDKNSEYETYKQKGTMKMNIQMEVDGLPKEELENQEMSQGMNMDLDMDIQVQAPDKAYIYEVIKSSNNDENMNQEVEIFMDGNIMYTKMLGIDKWVKQDLGSIMKQIQSLSNNEPYKMSQLSDYQLDFFKDYSTFGKDTKIESEEYYVVNIDIDKDAYKKYFMEIMEQTMDSIIELQVNNPQLQDDPSFDKDQYRQMMMQLMTQMETEVSYKFYINKETKSYDKMGVTQNVYMSMNNIASSIKEATEEEVKDISVKMLNSMEGEFIFYDFNQEVTFPEINPEDILENTQTNMEALPQAQ